MNSRLRLILMGLFFALMFVQVGVHTYVAMRFNPAFFGTGWWLKQEFEPVVHEPFHLKSRPEEVHRLDEVLQKCLAKDPAERFVSVAEMQEELIPTIEGCPPITAQASENLDSEAPTLSPE